VSVGRDRHDSVRDEREEQIRQSKVTEMVRSHMALKAVDGSTLRHHQDPGVVDEDVEIARPTFRERPHGRQILEIQVSDLCVSRETARDPLTLSDVPDREDDPGSSL
jgi:hypothetical protein